MSASNLVDPLTNKIYDQYIPQGAGLNIGVDNTIPTSPVVSLLAPLTSTLSLGTQSVTGTSAGNITR